MACHACVAIKTEEQIIRKMENSSNSWHQSGEEGKVYDRKDM